MDSWATGHAFHYLRSIFKRDNIWFKLKSALILCLYCMLFGVFGIIHCYHDLNSTSFICSGLINLLFYSITHSCTAILYTRTYEIGHGFDYLLCVFQRDNV